MARAEFYSLCRLCVQHLGQENVSRIFCSDSTDYKISLSERIKYCSSVNVSENDGLPPQICKSCHLKLNQSFVFRNQCVLADITLRHLVKNLTVNVSEIRGFLNADLENHIYTSTSSLSDILNSNNINNSVNSLESKKKFSDDLSGENKNCKRRRKSDLISVRNLTPPKGTNLINVVNNCQVNTETGKKDIRSKHHLSSGKRVCKKQKNMKDGGIGREQVENKTEVCTTDVPDVLGLCKVNKTRSETPSVSNTNVEKTVRSGGLLGLKKKGRSRKGLESPKKKPSSYTCDYCKKVYPSEGGWRYHIYTVHNENYQPFICELCGQSFKVKKNLEGHKNSIHFRLKLHLCDLCGRGFASRYALKVHKIWHNDERDFACDICGTKFRTRGKLNTHRSIHGGPKNFMCDICSRDFRWKNDFEVHMRTHTGEKPFKCSRCGKAFASLTNMKKHEKNHGDKPQGGPQTGEEMDEDSRNDQRKGKVTYKEEYHDLFDRQFTE